MLTEYPKNCFDRYLPPNPYQPAPGLSDAQQLASASPAVRAAIVISKRWANNSDTASALYGRYSEPAKDC